MAENLLGTPHIIFWFGQLQKKEQKTEDKER